MALAKEMKFINLSYDITTDRVKLDCQCIFKDGDQEEIIPKSEFFKKGQLEEAKAFMNMTSGPEVDYLAAKWA